MYSKLQQNTVECYIVYKDTLHLHNTTELKCLNQAANQELDLELDSELE